MSRRARHLLVGFTLMGLMALAAGPAPGAESNSVSFTVVAQGKTSAIREPSQVVIRDQAAWAALWRRHTGSTDAAPPAVDFDREMVIAIFAGEGSASQAISIGRIAHRGLTLMVWYTVRDTRPPADGDTVKTTAFEIIKTARSGLFVEFTRVKTQQPVRSP
jgi:hypothetical protein